MRIVLPGNGMHGKDPVGSNRCVEHGEERSPSAVAPVSMPQRPDSDPAISSAYLCFQSLRACPDKPRRFSGDRSSGRIDDRRWPHTNGGKAAPLRYPGVSVAGIVVPMPPPGAG
jgi:hypothetical protein